MTTLTNAQMLENMITILNKMKITDEDDFKKTMNNAIKNAMNDKKKSTKIKTDKESKPPTAYQLFVKEKMAEIKDTVPAKERMKKIAEMWKAQKQD